MLRTKKKSVCIHKLTPVLSDNDNSDSDTIDNLASLKEVLSLLKLLKRKIGVPRRSCLLKMC